MNSIQYFKFYFFILIFNIIVVNNSFANNALPEIPLKDSNGNAHLLKEYNDKVILLTFWTPSCPACHYQMPYLNKVATYFDKDDLEIIVITYDTQNASNYIINYNLFNLNLLLDAEKKIFNYYEIKKMPTSLIIDKKGKVVSRSENVLDWTSEEAIQLLHDHITNNNTANTNKSFFSKIISFFKKTFKLS